MERTKLLTLTVIGLLLLNLATLGFLFLNGPKPGRMPGQGRPEPKQIIIHKLHFDAKQQQEYEELIQWHRGEIDDLDTAIRSKKNLLYALITADAANPKNKEQKQRLLNELAHLQQQVEETHFKHFQDIRKLCNTQQQKEFDNMIGELPRIFAPKPRGPRHE